MHDANAVRLYHGGSPFVQAQEDSNARQHPQRSGVVAQAAVVLIDQAAQGHGVEVATVAHASSRQQRQAHAVFNGPRNQTTGGTENPIFGRYGTSRGSRGFIGLLEVLPLACADLGR